MRRIFLSSAPQDHVVTGALRDALTAAGAAIVEGSPEPVAEPVAREAEARVADADVFVAVLSPYYLTSAGCRRERSLALQRESGSSAGAPGFVRVVTAADTPYPESGSLHRHPWVDARPPLDGSKLSGIVAALLDGPLAPPATDPIDSGWAFRNRRDELDVLVDRLTAQGGRGLWTVVAPPRLGKSWFLDRLPRELTDRDPRWTCSLLDVREHPRELQGDPSLLLGALFQVDVEQQPAGALLPDAEIQRIVRTVVGRQRPQAYLLDSAELLTPDCAIHTRSALTAIHRRATESGSRDVRLSFVIGTRRTDNWRGLGLDPTIGRRFESLRLTPFDVDVVADALADRAPQLDEATRRDCAGQLHRISEGLPALLVPSLRWAERNSFPTAMADEGTALHEIADGSIRTDLLSAESLLPAGAPAPAHALAVLHRMLRALSTYRFFTLSHVSHHLEADREFADLLKRAQWSPTDLWEALSQMSLCDQTVTELWQVIAHPIRRLLYKHFFRSKVERIRSHRAAKAFYEGWTAIRAAGREQPVVLVECLWHEASRMALEQPDQLAHDLPSAATNLTYKFSDSPIYGPAEFSTFVARRLRDDEEFRLLLQDHDGLFDEVVKAVQRTVGERR
jgi:hypothetical protein